MLQNARHSSQRLAEMALLLGTVFWGCSFNWVKVGDDALNSAMGVDARSALGPMLLLGVRFFLGGVIWLAIFPRARRGWSKASVLRALAIGLLLFMGMTLQVVGLLTTTEAVSAFLTSLTVLFVPLLMTFVMRKPPGMAAWIGVILATVGIWLMTAGAPSGFGRGELEGLGASIMFAFYILSVNSLVPKDEPARMTAGQFIVCGAAAIIAVIAMRGADISLAPLATGVVLRPLVLLILLSTLCAYGLLIRFQPLVDPTRAAILYLAEPIFAAAFAWIAVGRKMGRHEIAGAGLILVANLVVEFLSRDQAAKMKDSQMKEQHGS